MGGFNQCASSNNSSLRDFLGIRAEVSSFCNFFLLCMGNICVCYFFCKCKFLIDTIVDLYQLAKYLGFPGSSAGKESAYRGFPGGANGQEHSCQFRDIGDAGLIPGSGRSSGEGHGNPLQCSWLENSMDRGAWRATVHGAQRVGCDWSDLAHTWQNIQMSRYWHSFGDDDVASGLNRLKIWPITRCHNNYTQNLASVWFCMLKWISKWLCM